jgi:hypothetical protein
LSSASGSVASDWPARRTSIVALAAAAGCPDESSFELTFGHLQALQQLRRAYRSNRPMNPKDFSRQAGPRAVHDRPCCSDGYNVEIYVMNADGREAAQSTILEENSP